MLDPQARALIDLMVERGVPAVHTLTPADARRYYLERRFFTQPEPPAVAEVRDLQTGDGVPLRLYRPHADGVHPVLVYFHGGGWTIGDLDTHDVLCRQLCAAAGVAVVAVGYRLAPEHRFPAAVDDCLAATRWLQREGVALGLDSAR
ncbi:MAG: alpha/beta hydrolase, partial [Rubrivivax sp.]|nr:alpha/beta hydrolase [Rubrivivax sp.]